MKRWLLIAAGVACTPADDGDGPPVSMNDSGADTAAESSSDSIADSTGADDGPDDGTDDGPGDGPEDGSTGEPGCAAGAEPATFSEVDGCAEVLGDSFCSEGQEHVAIGTEIPWMHDPPHSGPHFPMWETWGEHESTVERGYWVHNMEHGGIVLSYLCPDGCDADLEVLRTVIAERPDSRVLLTPDPELEGARFAAVSWTWVHRFETADLGELLCFVDQHFNHAPEDVP